MPPDLPIPAPPPSSWLQPWPYWLALALAFPLAAGLLVFAVRRLRGTAAERPLRLLRGLALPLAVLLAVLFGLGVGIHTLAFRLVETALTVVAVGAGLLLIRTWFVSRRRGPNGAPRLLVDLVTFALIVITVGLLLSRVWHYPVGDLLTTLGLGSIVIGLALQDTLGNLFAGISLMTERPYAIGDWITIDGTEGRVVEVNWRAVHVMTRNQDLVVFPNAMVAQSVIVNEVRPSPLKAVPVSVGFSYNDPPNQAKAVLREAARDTRGVRHDPAPTVRVTGYDDSSIGYEVRLFIDDHDTRPDIIDRFNSRVWYAARRAGLNIPFPIRTVYHQKLPDAPEPTEDTAVEALESVEIFAVLSEDERAQLAESTERHTFGNHEQVVRQGDPGDALYLVRTGRANVLIDAVRDARGRVEGTRVGTLGPGDVFGEMAVLTGEPRSASVVADGDLDVLAVRPDALRPLLEARPDLADAIAAVVTARQAQLDDNRRAAADRAGAGPTTEQRQLTRRIRSFLGL